jgi:hypothetical protein
MKPIFSRRLCWLLWFLALALFFGDWLYPVSNVLTRSAGCVLLALVWLGALGLAWNCRGVRFAWVGLSLLAAIFISLPARRPPNAQTMREAYVAGLRRYAGDRYYWGGESPKGIDCSGLIRRGLVDALFLQGLRSLDPGLVRASLWHWWNDCTARDLMEGHGFTRALFGTPSINALGPNSIEPGDLAVITSGSHVLAYLGDRQWIEADPGIERVVIVDVPSRENLWFHAPMRIVRWKILDGQTR